MDHIVEPDSLFDFSKLALSNPIAVQGSAYFTKISYQGHPLYIQTPKCLTKQGIVKHNRKMYVDLLLDTTHETFIQWLEHLEESCQALIFSKSDSWFQTPLEKSDIESSFVSPIKIYKSGKNYLVRVPIKVNTINQSPYVKIYNENTDELSLEDIHPDTSILSIVEIVGIKFTTRNFQIEMECKKIMTIGEIHFLNNCFIRKKEDTRREEKKEEQERVEEIQESKEETREEEKKEEEQEETREEERKKEEEERIESKAEEKKTLHVNFLDDDEEELKEVEVTPEDIEEPLTLKKPNQVFYEIYRRAKEKAREAKREALKAILEAKNIKKTYMLDSDSDEEDGDDFSLDEEEGDSI
jgi:hypothetical protein